MESLLLLWPLPLPPPNEGKERDGAEKVGSVGSVSSNACRAVFCGILRFEVSVVSVAVEGNRALVEPARYRTPSSVRRYPTRD